MTSPVPTTRLDVDDRALASLRSFATTLSVPGGTSVRANAVGGVTVPPTHEGRGLVRRWMTRDLSQARERGDVASVLYASEAGFYGRFGFGISTAHATATLHVPRARFLDERPGTMRLVTGDEALEVLPGIGRRAQLARPGSIEPPADYWRSQARPLSGGADRSRRFAVHRDEDGRPDGVVSYTLAGRAADGTATSTANIHVLVAANPLAERELWRHCAGIDVVMRVVHELASPDDDLPWWLTDRRAVTLGPSWDGLWVRLLDVPAALGARRYPVVGRGTIEVVDPGGLTQGRYLLETDATGAGVCSPVAATEEPADLRIGVADLGSLWLGGGSGVPSLSTLVDAGRAQLADPGALSRLSALFGWPMPARSLTTF